MILAGDSQCFWFLSALLAQLKDDSYRPSNPSLFDRSISALSAALAAQTSVAANMSEYVTTKRRESYLAHASLPDNLKRELLVAPGTDSLLFNQSLLSTAVENMKEGSLLSSTSSLATLSKAAAKNKLQGGTSRYSSPLDAPRAGSSGFRKRSASPSSRGAKRGRGGRGGTPTLSREPIPYTAYCPHTIWGKALAQEVESAPEGSHRAGSASFAGLLQPLICSHEGLGVVAASNRSFGVERQSTQNTIQDGDSPVCSVVSPQGRLDGLHRSKGCISSSCNASGIQKISSVHGIQQSLPIQGSLLWSVHGSAGLHAGHGSGFGDSPQSWNSASMLSGRLADSSVLPRAGSSCSEDGPPVV